MRRSFREIFFAFTEFTGYYERARGMMGSFPVIPMNLHFAVCVLIQHYIRLQISSPIQILIVFVMRTYLYKRKFCGDGGLNGLTFTPRVLLMIQIFIR